MLGAATVDGVASRTESVEELPAATARADPPGAASTTRSMALVGSTATASWLPDTSFATAKVKVDPEIDTWAVTF